MCFATASQTKVVQSNFDLVSTNIRNHCLRLSKRTTVSPLHIVMYICYREYQTISLSDGLCYHEERLSSSSAYVHQPQGKGHSHSLHSTLSYANRGHIMLASFLISAAHPTCCCPLPRLPSLGIYSVAHNDHQLSRILIICTAHSFSLQFPLRCHQCAFLP